MNLQSDGVSVTNGKKEICRIRYLQPKDVKQAIGLQLKIVRALRRAGHSNYIIPKTKEQLQAIYAHNHMNSSSPERAIGLFMRGKIIAHALIVQPSLADMPVVHYSLPTKTAEVTSVLTDFNYHGNGIMQQMLGYAEQVARNDIGADSMCSVVVPGNISSWKGFMDNGYQLIGLGPDPFDGVVVYSTYKNISNQQDKSFHTVKNVSAVKIDAGEKALSAQKDAFKHGYIVTDFDPVSKKLTFKKTYFGKHRDALVHSA